MFIPYKVDVPMQRWPVANWVLMGITILISVAMFGPLARWDEDRQIAPISPEAMEALRDAGITVRQPEPSIVDSFLLQPGNFRTSQLVGNLFIHEGFLHLAGNMLFLWVFGNAVNAKLGHLRYVALYLAAGIIESSVWLIAGPKAPCLGASGAIMGVVGGFLLLYPLNDVSIGYMFTFYYSGKFEVSAMWAIAVYFAFDIWGLATHGNSGVAYLSHVTGFIVGAMLVAVLLLAGLLKMTEDERSLLQIWRLMPGGDHEGRSGEVVASPLGLGDTPDYASRRNAKARSAGVMTRRTVR